MHVYRLFAEILDYPSPALAERVEELLSLASVADGEAARLLGRFREFVEESSPETREELYTGTFDLQPLCYPHVGYHLFGEEYRRGMFMAKLREHYRSCGFADGEELPDHICIILRFLGRREPRDVERELVAECLIPALEKMVASVAAAMNPYCDALQALLLLLVAGYPGQTTQAPGEG